MAIKRFVPRVQEVTGYPTSPRTRALIGIKCSAESITLFIATQPSPSPSKIFTTFTFYDAMSGSRTSSLFQRAPPPFDAPDADIIIRSSDNIDFRVHGVILKLWSPWWSDVLGSVNSTNVPIISVDEDAQTTCHLLRYVYPQQDTKLPTLEVALNVLQAARKYTIVAALKDAKKAVAEYAHASPLATYDAAERLQMAGEMRVAATASLTHGPLEDIDDPVLESMRASPYRHLLLYHRRCAKAATAPLDNLLWMSDIAAKQGWHPVWAACPNLACHKSGGFAQWFWGFLRAVRETLARAPCALSLENLALVEETVRAARSCEICSSSVRQDLQKFNALLKERVERDVEVVSYCALCCPRV